MRIRIIILLIFSTQLAFSQCPTLSFNADSVLCLGDTLNIQNTSSGGAEYLWDFCLGDIENGADTSLKGDFSADFTNPYGNDLVYDNGMYYGFVINNAGSLVRLDFGTSLSNTPTAVNLGNFSLLTSTWDVNIIKQDSLWFAYVTSSTNKLFKIDFGTDIYNNSPIGSEIIITGGSLVFPLYLETVFDGNNYFAVLTNQNSSELSIVNLGPDLSIDSATVSNIALPFTSPQGVDVVNDCGQWYVFVGFFPVDNIVRLDFGNSLLNTPTSTSFTATGTTNGILDLQVINNGSWYILTVDRLGTGMNFIDLGPSITNTNATITNYLINSAAYFAFNFKKVNSVWYSIQNGFSSKDLTVINFNDSCSANIATDSNYTPPGIIYTAYSTQIFLLESYDSLRNYNFIVDSVLINPNAIPNFNSSGSCINTAVNFTDLSTISSGSITSWTWNFGDGFSDTIQNPTHIYTATGAYNVILTVAASNGCSAFYSDSITIENKPVTNFNFINNQCANKSIQFTDSSMVSGGSISFWNWDFGDGNTSSQQNPTHSYSSPGMYDVTLVSSATPGCDDTLVKQITILPSPEPSFTVINTCIGDTISFTNTTIIQGGILSNYFWDFGDGDTSINTDPIHAYSGPSTIYDVQLIAYATNGCSDTLNRDIKTNIKPFTDFNLSDTLACTSEPITFTDISTVAGDTIISRIWDFGDGGTDSSEIVTYAYNTPGVYTVKLTAFSPTSCDSSSTKIITILAGPSVSYNYSNGCEGDSVLFSNTTIPAPGSTITGYTWDFGDGFTDTLVNPSHLYSTAGIYNVSLFVTDDQGCFASDTQSIFINDVPIADFSLNATCSNVNIQFTDQTTIAGDTIQQWFWDFGDTNTSTLRNPVHNYSTPGTYTIQLIVISSFGCSDTISKTFNFNQTPLANFSFTQTCDGNPVPFTYLPIVFPSPVTNWLWNFGDGATSTIVNPAHIYAGPGSYNVTLTVSDSVNNCSSTVSNSISVDPIPNVNFGWLGNCFGQPIQFSDSSTISSGTLLNWDWNFGDGNFGNGQTVLHTYDTTGNFTVTLIPRSLRGCTDSLKQVIKVDEVPNANFNFTPLFGSPPIIINFNNTSSGALNYTWNFDDSTNLSNDINPNHLFQNSGIYNVSLVAENIFGCTDTSVQSLNIFDPRNDIAIQDVITEINSGLLTIKVILLNVGNIPITSVELEAQASSYGIISELWSGSIEPNSPPLLFEFSAHIKIDENIPPDYVCVNAIEPNELPDYDIGNNEKCIPINGSIQILEPFPNPFEDEIIIGINLPSADNLRIDIINLNGSLVNQAYKAATSKGLHFIPLNIDNLSQGIYFLKITYSNQEKYIKVIKN